MNKKAIIFDFGGVLLDLDISRTEKAMSKLIGATISHPYPDKYKEITLALETGKINQETFIWTIQNMCEQVPDAREVIDAWNAMLLGWQSDRFLLLKELREKYQVYLLSNTNQIHLDYVMKELSTEYDIHEFESTFFDQCFYSHRLGLWKPDRKIYESVQESIGLSSEEFVFIDDNHSNVAGAHATGWNAYHHPTNTDLRVTLQKIDLL